VATCSLDKTVQSWDLNTFSHDHTYQVRFVVSSCWSSPAAASTLPLELHSCTEWVWI
jgi:hypothetical protein